MSANQSYYFKTKQEIRKDQELEGFVRGWREGEELSELVFRQLSFSKLYDQLYDSIRVRFVEWLLTLNVEELPFSQRHYASFYQFLLSPETLRNNPQLAKEIMDGVPEDCYRSFFSAMYADKDHFSADGISRFCASYPENILHDQLMRVAVVYVCLQCASLIPEVKTSPLQHITISIKVIRRLISKKFISAVRDFRYIFRTVIRFHFKQIDDESDVQLFVLTIGKQYLNFLNLSSNEHFYRRDRTDHYASAIAA